MNTLIQEQAHFWQAALQAVEQASKAMEVEAAHAQTVVRLQQQIAALEKDKADREDGLARFTVFQQTERERLRAAADAERVQMRSLVDAEQSKLLNLRQEVAKCQRQIDVLDQQARKLDREVALRQSTMEALHS